MSTQTQTIWTENRNYVGKCKCGAKFCATATIETMTGATSYGSMWQRRNIVTIDLPSTRAWQGEIAYLMHQCQCQQVVALKPVKVTTTDKQCDSRCTGAVRQSCSCSCGGKNHGAAHKF